jgi:hypothetical protein
MVLSAVVLKGGERLAGLVLPVKGKIPVEDLCALLNIKSHATVKKLLRDKQIRYHKIGHKWVVDLEDLWGKTAQNYTE